MRLALVVPCLTAWSASAQTPMTPDDFDAWSVGRTLDYSVNGQIYGSEAYFPDRRVRDADTGGPCREGSWHAEGPAVCFVYQAIEGTHCWLYWREGDAVYAQPVNAGPGDPPQLVAPSPAPLTCPAPDLGV